MENLFSAPCTCFFLSVTLLYSKEMQSCLSEVHRVQKEAEEVLTTTEVMNQRHMCSLEHFEKFKAD